MKEEKKLRHYSNKRESVKITSQMQNIINLTHVTFQQELGSACSRETGIVLNSYVGMLCTNKKMTMVEFANFLREENHLVYTPSALNEMLFRVSSYRQYPRLFQDSEPLLNWSKEASKLLLQAFQGKRKEYDELNAYLKTSAYPNKYLLGNQVRFLLIAFYSKYPWLDKYGDMGKLLGYESYVFFYKYLDIMLDAICSEYGFSPCTFLKEKIEIMDKRRQQEQERKKLQLQVNNQRIDQLQSNLSQRDSMLQDLQDNFDNQLADSKVIALTDFFAQLNSDRYGNILDMVLQLRKGVAALSKSGYELPEELNGLFTLYHKLVQFIRDSHIDPIRKIGSQAIVHASDIEFCIYEGTPFTSENETKLVETISPGWIYRDQNIQISRPKVKEVIAEENLQDDKAEDEEALCAENPEAVDIASIAQNEAAEEALCLESDEIVEVAEAVQDDKAEDEEALCAENPEAVDTASIAQNEAAEEALCLESDEIVEVAEAVQDDKAENKEESSTENSEIVEVSETPQSSETEVSEEELCTANDGVAEKADISQEGSDEEPLRDEGTEPIETSGALPSSNKTEAADK